MKDLNSTFNDIVSPFSLFHLNINSLSFHFDELESLISKSKNDFQIIGISETQKPDLRKLRKQLQIFNWKILILNMYQLNQRMGECCCISEKQLTIN